MQDRFFKVKKGVIITPDIADKVKRMAGDFHATTGKRITVTSATRSPLSQARAMYRKCASGGSLSIYRQRSAAAAIEKAYHEAVASGLAEEEVVDIMTAVIAAQVESGIYISAHLRSGAVDIRSRDMDDSQRQHFKAIADRHCETVLLEKRPPHWHLQF